MVAPTGHSLAPSQGPSELSAMHKTCQSPVSSPYPVRQFLPPQLLHTSRTHWYWYWLAAIVFVSLDYLALRTLVRLGIFYFDNRDV